MSVFQPLQAKAYAHLKRMIENNELQPDTYYSETKLAKELNISRTPLKDALVRLSQDKYIDIVPSKGFKLHTISEDDIEDTYQVRLAVELLCALTLIDEQSSASGRLVLKQLSNILDEMSVIANNPEQLAVFLKLDTQFHFTLVQCLNNQSLESVYSSHSYQIRTLAAKSLASENRMYNTYKEHDAILKAIIEKDFVKCYRAVEAHLISTRFISLTQIKTEGQKL